MRTQNSVKNYMSAKVTSDAFIAPPAEGNNIFRLVELFSYNAAGHDEIEQLAEEKVHDYENGRYDEANAGNYRAKLSKLLVRDPQLEQGEISKALPRFTVHRFIE